MIGLFQSLRWSVALHWRSGVCYLLPSLNFVEMRCESEGCNELHGWALDIGWLWGSLVIEHLNLTTE